MCKNNYSTNNDNISLITTKTQTKKIKPNVINSANGINNTNTNYQQII